MPLSCVPAGSSVYSIELTPGRGGQIARSAGSFATVMSNEGDYAQIKLPSGEIRRIHTKCMATIGQVGNTEHENIVIGSAGRNRHRGRRPMTRGVCRNPVDHPNGGGNGKSKSGGGRQHLVSPWGLSWPKVIKPDQSTNLPTNSFWFDETVAPIKLNNFHHGTFN